MTVIHLKSADIPAVSQPDVQLQIETARLSLLRNAARLVDNLSDTLCAGDTNPIVPELQPQVSGIVRALKWLEKLEAHSSPATPSVSTTI